MQYSCSNTARESQGKANVIKKTFIHISLRTLPIKAKIYWCDNRVAMNGGRFFVHETKNEDNKIYKLKKISTFDFRRFHHDAQLEIRLKICEFPGFL